MPQWKRLTMMDPNDIEKPQFGIVDMEHLLAVIPSRTARTKKPCIQLIFEGFVVPCVQGSVQDFNYLLGEEQNGGNQTIPGGLGPPAPEATGASEIVIADGSKHRLP